MKKISGNIVVWFSCGAASAVAAKKTLELYPDCNVDIINSPIAEEDDDNRRFLFDVEKWLNKKIKIIKSDKFPNQSAVEVWKKKKFMSSISGAPCTAELKKYPRQQFERQNKVDWNVLGFTSEEKNRADRFMLTERDNLLPVLINENISKVTCMEIINNAGISLPKAYKMGYPNANCIGCVKATSPTYWNLVRKTHPEVFQQRLSQSRELGVKLTRVKGKRIFLDELKADVTGGNIKNHLNECGLFCEEKNDKT
tara:strand:+ start:1139 stop:1900 length:762 start_codon:yes stop_codon:yes gene_type:complete